MRPLAAARPAAFRLALVAAFVLGAGRSDAAEGPALRSPAGVAFTGDGRLVVADTGNDRLVAYDVECRFLEVIGETGTALGQFRSPRGIAVDSTGRVYVADSGNARIVVLDAALRPVAALGANGALGHPTGVAVAADGRLFVSDEERHGVAVLSPQGEILGTIEGSGNERLRRPSGLAYEDRTRTLFVANAGFDRIDVFTVGADERAEAVHRGPVAGTVPGLSGCPGVALLTSGQFAALDASGEVRTYDDTRLGPGGAPLATFSGGTLGRLREPRAIAADGRGRLAIADAGNHRVVVVRESFSTPRRPDVRAIDETSAVFEWRCEEPGATVVLLRPGDAPEDPDAAPPAYSGALRFEGAGGGPVRAHAVRASGLEPGRRYYFKVLYSEALVLPGKGVSGEFALATRAPSGRTEILEIPVSVVLYSHAYDPAALPEGVAPPPPLDAERVAAIRAEIDEAVLFYWINSGLKLRLDVDFTVVSRTIRSGAETPDPLRDLEPIVAARGGSWASIPSVVAIVAEQAWRTETKSWELVPSGGETTPVRYPKPAVSTFLAGSDVAWLFTHEMHHQIDSFLEAAGYSEYPHNHFSPSEGNVARFGDHYDGNAYWLRRWPARSWFFVPFGRVRTVADADGDGVPDADASLPLDEARLGGDPGKADTDDDGLDDLRETMTTIGIRSLLTARGNRKPDLPAPGLANPDTDGDGVRDGDDPYPLYAVRESIPQKTALVDGKLGDGEWSPFFLARSGAFAADVRAQWDERNLYLGFLFPNGPPAEFAFDLDVEDDGWYVGRDNLSARIEMGEDGVSAAVADLVVNDASNPGSWPERKSGAVDRSRLLVAGARLPDGRVLVEIAIPKMPEIGHRLVPGSRLSIAPSFRPEPRGDWVPAFEPYALVAFRLAAGGF